MIEPNPPVLSLVSAVYGVAEYLPAYLDSIDAQTVSAADLGRVEFVFVDDGSPDDSAALVEAWQAAHPGRNVRLLRQDNRGAAGARNTGLEAATGEWVSFPDPDDVLGPDYLRAVLDFADSPAADGVQLLVSNFVFLQPDGAVSDRHLLRYRFEQGTRVADLVDEPHLTVVATNHTFLRREVLLERGLRQDERIYPVWEDGHLTARYLGGYERPRIALLADAKYVYRRRADGTSAMQGQWQDPRKFTVVPRLGWLDALRTVAAERGQVPVWLAHMVLYDLIGYYERERQSPSPTGWVPADLGAQFLAVAGEVLDLIDTAAIESYRTTRVAPDIQRALITGMKGEEARPVRAFVDRTDPARRVERIHYYFAGERPVERFEVDGAEFEPTLAKYRPSEFFDRQLMSERVAWVPSDRRVALQLDGRPIAIERSTEPAPPRFVARTKQTLKQHGAVMAARSSGLRLLARTPWAARRYANAWLLLDKDSAAGDNAEHLYRWLREHRPEVNAWFILRRDSSDWPRLEREGFRLLAFRSPQQYLALQHAKHLISSHLDRYVTEMLPPVIAPARWKYSFLQHGMTKDDQSIWFNPKPIELLVTSSQDEHDAMVGDETNYLFTDREIKLVGMPRFDRLLELGTATPAEQRRTLLVMPTWRRNLLQSTKVQGRGNERLLLEDFWDSEYAQQWRKVIESERLHEVADAHGWQIEFIPHPNMQRYLDDSPLPQHVSVHRFDDIDIQEMFARAGALVTDYSSVAFDVAYLERPVVYFQFDHGDFFTGGHIYQPGLWSYEAQGFGPITTDAQAAVDALVAIVERGGAAEPEYARRIADTFALRDGKCCERTYVAVRDLYRPLTLDEMSAAAAT